ncbi:BnaCnng37200D [Brassica napus]|uniref:BnaCnng37200D protein n=1 Tax=Brassica napus TaxID=3708 RepID=A0A078J9Z7_BRANA|nr:BnaCnng37200D [Brassica napus]
MLRFSSFMDHSNKCRNSRNGALLNRSCLYTISNEIKK